MKAIKYIGIALLLLILAVLSLGMIKPTVQYGHQITVDKPISEVWGVCQDESKYAEWLAGFQSMELLSGEKGQAGSTYKIVVKPSPEEAEFVMTETLNEVKMNELVDMTFDSEMMVFDQQMLFSETDGKTTVETKSTVSGKGYFIKTMFAAMELFTGSFQAQEEANVEALKKVIEENTTAY